MKIKVFTLRLDDTTGEFDDRPVAEFLLDRDALAVYPHFFHHEGVATIALVVPYRERGRSLPSAPRRPDGGIEVPLPDRPLFEALRLWRNERAKRDGRPSYVLFNNAQLAAIAASRPATKAALAEVPGIGAARLRDYADEILALITAGTPGG